MGQVRIAQVSQLNSPNRCVFLCLLLSIELRPSSGFQAKVHLPRVSRQSRQQGRPVVHGIMGCGQKALRSVVVPTAPVRIPSQSPLSPSVTSVMSTRPTCFPWGHWLWAKSFKKVL